MEVVTNSIPSGAGDVLPGSLLGPILGLAFSTDGDLLFAGSGSSISTYDVLSGAVLSSARVFTPGLAVCGIDVGRESFGAIFGDKCVRVVDGVPTGADTLASAVAWFRGVARLPDLNDRVWDARLVGREGEGEEHKAGEISTSSAVGGAERLNGGKGLPCQVEGKTKDEGERGEEGRKRGERAGMGLVAVALAHNSVEVWDWASNARPLRIHRTRGGDPCLLYHARLWGRTLDDLRVAAGTAFNQVLVWSPGEVSTTELKPLREKDGATDLEARGGKAGKVDMLPTRVVGVLRLSGHEGVIFRVAWRGDGRRLASASDDRTVRVWDVECSERDGDVRHKGERLETKERSFNERLVWTGWGHASRVWDVGFTRLGIVTSGEDGAAILWRENDHVYENSTTFAPGDTIATATRPTPAIPAATAAMTTSALATPPEPRLGVKREVAQLVPAAVMRGHSGASVWRLAVHEFASRSSSSSSSSGICKRFAAGDSTHEERKTDWRGLTLMATGGNDGACKLWDLGFEATLERRRLWGKRAGGMLWGQTEVIPIDQGTAVSTDENTAVGETQENGHPAPVVTTLPPGTTGTPPAVASGATPPADTNKKRSERAAAAVNEGPKSNPTEPSSNAPSPRTPSQQAISGDRRHLRRGRQGPSVGGASRRQNDRRRQKPAVVREVRLVRGCSRTTAAAAATAAALLLADGSVWWVADLHIGSWQQVTVSTGHAAAAGGVTAEGYLSSSGISAIAVVGLLEQIHTEENSNFGSDSDGKVAAGKKGGRCGHEVAIVAGRGDGRLFLLTQGRTPPTVISEANFSDFKPGSAADGGEGGRTASPPRPWRVSTVWVGHRSRVISVWIVGDAAHETPPNAPEGESSGYTAALDTSRLSSSSRSGGLCRGGLYGALVSAGADGTVAWWEWARAEDVRDVADGGSPSSCEQAGGEVTACAPRLRMLCRAGPGAAITSVTIDGRRQRYCHSVKTKHRDAEQAKNDAPSLAGAVFCGDTKGNIRCFLEEPRAGSRRSEGGVGDGEEGRLSAEEDLRGRPKKGLAPCLVLKRQHGKDQITRLALRGDCLFSAGHDGQVHQYAISYSAPYFDRPAESHRHGSPVGTDSQTPTECPITPSRPVDLTILTTYATAPVTAVSELWVSKEFGRGAVGIGEARPRWGVQGEKVRLAVAGRSGSSKMSVWDITEARQILELECGDRHLAHDLFLSWPSIKRAPMCASTPDQPWVSSVTTIAPNVDRDKNDTNRVESGVAQHSTRKSVPEFTPPLLELPRHTFVSAQPFSRTKVKNVGSSSSSSSSIAGKLRPGGTTTGDETNTRNRQRYERPGVALAFHSSFFSLGYCGPPPATGDRSRVLQQERAREVRPATNGAAVVEEGDESEVSGARGDGKRLALPTEARPDHFQRYGMASSDSDTTRTLQRGRSRDESNGSGGGGGGGGGCAELQLPGRFRYSLGEPFHSQRVASVRFIIPAATPARREARTNEGGLSDLRLVTGGEDGAVKLLDVFYKRRTPPNTTDDPGRHRHFTQSPRYPSSGTFHLPCVKVVQSLPSHESSVGALGVGTCGGGGDPNNIHGPTGLQSTLFVSGGGKLETRAWCIGGVESQSGSKAGGYGSFGETSKSTCAPPVRWLSTTTPAPKSQLHAHRIMCLCVLPPPPQQRLRLPAASDTRGSTAFVAGDSGGGVTVFELRRGAAAAAGSVAAGSSAASSAAVGGGQREARSRPAGRWMTSSKKPVLCLAHARVRMAPALPSSSGFPSPAPLDVVDLIATGDTGGTITVWEFLSGGGGGGILPPKEGEIFQQGVSDVRGGFVHRGPAGKRRGGTEMVAEETRGGERSYCPGLVPMLEYRAHQMGVLCMAVHVPPAGGRMVIISGGDDQAVCVAEVELRERPAKSPDQAPRCEEERGSTCQGSEKASARERRFAARLVGSEPEVTNGAAGSAIKGIHVMSVNAAKSPIAAKSPAPWVHKESPAVEQLPAASPQTGFEPHVTSKMLDVPGFAAGARLSVFTISRDQRLSRWDLVEEDKSLSTSISETPGAVTGANNRQYFDCRTTLGDDAESSTSAGVGGEGNRATPNDIVTSASDEMRAELLQRGEHGLRKRTRQGRKEEQRRWRLRWRAGCVTDVCDINGLDAVPLVDSQLREHVGDETDHLPRSPPATTLGESEGTTAKMHEQRPVKEEASTSPAALVAVSGQGLQLVLFGAC